MLRLGAPLFFSVVFVVGCGTRDDSGIDLGTDGELPLSDLGAPDLGTPDTGTDAGEVDLDPIAAEQRHQAGAAQDLAVHHDTVAIEDDEVE